MSSGRLKKIEDGSEGCSKCFEDGDRRWKCPHARLSTSGSFILKDVKTPFWCAAPWNGGKNQKAVPRNYY